MKCYTCGNFPNLKIASVGNFTNGVLELHSQSLIDRLEQSDSFKQGIVREYVPPPEEVVSLPPKTDIVKMTKAQLQAFIEEYGLEASSRANRNELVTIVLEFVSEADELEE